MTSPNIKHSVLGVGAPILDYLIHVSEEYLIAIGGKKGGMEVVDYETMLSIIENSGHIPKEVAGGSSTNTIKGLARLGHACAVTGKIGQDFRGEKVLKSLAALNIATHYRYSATPTAHVASLITPDGMRTMRSFLGACSEMCGEDLQPKIFEGAGLVHIEGYTLLCRQLTKTAMVLAKEAGALVSFDLGSFEVINTFKLEITDLLSNYVNIVFANEDEIHALFEQPPHQGCAMLSSLCELAVVMLGKKGCLVGYRGNVKAYPAYPVVAIDTTGAGDLFASGFLHGYLQGKPLEECAHYGALTGAAVVQVIGAEIPDELWPLSLPGV